MKLKTHRIQGGQRAVWRCTLLFALAVLLCCASAWVCAAQQPERKDPASAGEAGPAGLGSQHQRLLAQAPAEKKTTQSGGAAKSAKSAASKSPGKKGAASKKSAGPSPRALLLQSAGRDASAPQPEAGFTLSVPESIGDGEVFLLEFGAEGAHKLNVQWRGKSLNLGPCPGGEGVCRALLPTPLDEKAKTLPLSMTVVWADGKKETFSAPLPVKLRKYPVQKLKVASKFVSPPKEMQEKIKRDRAEFSAAVSKVTPVRYWSLPFLRPVPGEVTSLFGLRRVFNNVPKNPHKGVDFDAKADDPIYAAEGGTVVMASDRYYSGNTVIVDHGLGVMTAYLHMSAFNVAVGQKVERGDVLGFIGSTGRSTGPHLHLSLLVFGVSVNAAPCVAM